MKIYVLGSNRFLKEMVACKNKLCELELDGWIHPDYEAYNRGEKMDIWNRAHNGEHVQVKKENDYVKAHYRNICASDAILVVNSEKDGVENYIGPNVLIEMGQAYVNDKKIFLLNEIPIGMPHTDEIETFDPICLHGDLRNIKN
jgi:hypothetical protein